MHLSWIVCLVFKLKTCLNHVAVNGSMQERSREKGEVETRLVALCRLAEELVSLSQTAEKHSDAWRELENARREHSQVRIRPLPSMK